MSYEIFWLNTLSNFIATLVGIGIGLPLALWLDRIARARNETDRLAEAKKRAHKILTLLDSELQKNQQYIGQFHEDVANNFFPVRMKLWNAFSDGGEIQWIDDPDLLSQLSDSYAQIGRFDQIFQEYTHACLYPGMVGGSDLKQKIFYSIIQVKTETIDQINSTRFFIKTKLGQLNQKEENIMPMTDEEKIEATAAINAKQKSLELLFDYTKFHIGL